MNKQTDSNNNLTRRNKRAVLLISALVFFLLGSLVLLRFVFLNNGGNLGKVEGVSSTNELNALTQINFLDSSKGNSPAIFNENMKSPFVPDNSQGLWMKFNSGERTYVGYLNKEGKFVNVYDLPSTIRLVRLLEEGSLLLTDEPPKEKSTLYYVQKEIGSLELVTLDIEDSFLSIYYEPSERLVYYLYKDGDDIVHLNSVNESSKISNIYKSSDLTKNSKIVFVSLDHIYFQDQVICYELSFSSKDLIEVECNSVRKNAEGFTISTNPLPAPLYSTKNGGELFKINLSGEKISVANLSENEVISKYGYSGGKIVFVKARLTQTGENSWKSEDKVLYALVNNQISEITQKLPLGAVTNYYSFNDKFYALSPTLGLLEFQSSGFSTTIYLGEAVPSSYATVTQYWRSMDLGMVPQNLEVLTGDFML